MTRSLISPPPSLSPSAAYLSDVLLRITGFATQLSLRLLVVTTGTFLASQLSVLLCFITSLTSLGNAASVSNLQLIDALQVFGCDILLIYSNA